MVNIAVKCNELRELSVDKTIAIYMYVEERTITKEFMLPSTLFLKSPKLSSFDSTGRDHPLRLGKPVLLSTLENIL